MRIVFVTTSYPRRDGDFAGSFLAASAEALSRRGHTVRVLAPSAPGVPDEEELPPGVTVERVSYWPSREGQRLCYGGGIPDNLRRSIRAWIQIPLFFRAMARAVARHAAEADILHAHWSVNGRIAAGAARRSGTPLVLSVRGSDLAASLPPLRWMTRRALAASDAVVCVSEENRERLRSLGVADEKLRLVPNGVDTLRDRPVTDAERLRARIALDLPPDAPTLLYVGRCAAVKNVPLAVRAFARAAAEIPASRFVIIAGGPERPAVERAVSETDLGERIRFLDTLPRPEALRWMVAADALVLSSDDEGRPNVVLEAMGTGLPVVSTRAGGAADLIVDDETGILCETGDEAALADGVARLLGDAGLRARMGAAAQQRVRDLDLTWERNAEQLEALYRALADPSRNALPAG